jgi:hypothetical protein
LIGEADDVLELGDLSIAFSQCVISLYYQLNQLLWFSAKL